MYYKVVNQESEVYQKLRALREDEIRMDKENKELILKNVPCEWSYQYAHGQQSFVRTIQYVAFQFVDLSRVDPKVWKKYKDDPAFFEPNRKSKEGKRISELIRNGIQQSNFTKIYKILGLHNDFSHFTIPYLEIFDETILVFVDGKYKVACPDVIEITETESDSIIASYRANKAKEAQP